MAGISLFAGIAAGLASGMMLPKSTGQCSTDTASDPEAVRGMHGACVRDPDMAPARAPLLRLIMFGFWMNLFCSRLLAGETLGPGELADVCVISLTSALVVVCGRIREDSSFLCQRLWDFLSYCWGIITWYLLGRVLDMHPIVASLPGGAILAIWLSLLVVCMAPIVRQRVGCLARRGSRHADSASSFPACTGDVATPGATDGIDNEESVRNGLVEMGLTEREATVALAAMRGKTSRQIGDDLGIRPSTVRNHLSHAYRKCDVASASELKRRVAAACAIEAPGTGRTTMEAGNTAFQGCGRGENRQSKALADHRRTFLIRVLGCVRALYIAAMVAFAAVSFIPTGFEQAGWGYGRDIMMGFSTAPCVAAALVLHLTSDGGIAMRVSRTRGVSLACSLVPAAASIMVCYALPIDPWDLALLVHDPVEVLLIFVISGTYGAGAVLVVVAYARSTRYGAAGHRGRFGILILFVAGTVALIYGASRDPTIGRMVLAGLMCFAALLEQLLLWRYGGQGYSGGGAAAACCESSHINTCDAITLGLIMAVAAVVGCAYEETWRNSGPYSLMYVMLPLVVFACLLLMLAAARQPAMLRPMLVLVGVACCALFLGASAMHTCLLVAGALLGACLANRVSHSSLDFAAFEVLVVGSSCTAGMLAGDILVNLWGDASDAAIVRLGFSEAEPFRLGTSMAVGCAIALLAVILLYASWRALQTERAFVSEVHLGESEELRARAYLVYRGLSSLQVDVLMGISRGKSGREIAQELSYSLGSVNTARAAAYKALGIHSSKQLMQLLVDAISTDVSSTS